MTEIKREISQIFLDYDDKSYDDVLKSPISESNLEKILMTGKKMKISINAVCIRRSSGGRLHVMISIDEPISFIWSMIFRIRLEDCLGRVTSDFNRYLNSGGDITKINRLFNYKLVGGEERRAGEWITIYRNRQTEQQPIIEA